MHMQKMSDYVPANQAAAILGISAETLRYWRFSGKHLDALTPYVYVNRKVYYKRTDVERFVDANMTAVFQRHDESLA